MAGWGYQMEKKGSNIGVSGRERIQNCASQSGVATELG